MFTALILSLALVCTQDAPELPVLKPGAVGVGEIRPEKQARLALKIETEGTVTISVEALRFDPFVAIEDGQGRTIARDDDSGTSDGAWLILDVSPFVTYEIVVGAQTGGGGKFHLDVRDGRVDPPDETEAEGLSRLYRTIAEHERDKGNAINALNLHYESGVVMYGLGEYALAMPPFREAQALAVETAQPALEIASNAHLGGCERRIGDFDVGVAMLEQAWEQRARANNPQVDCLILEQLGEAHFDRSELAEALEDFDEWARIAAETGLAHFEALAHTRRGKALEVAGDRQGAADAHDKALALLDTFEDVRTEVQVLLAAGQFLKIIDQYDEAARVLLLAAGMPTSWEVHLAIQIELGHVQISRGRYGHASQCLERAAAILGDRDDRDEQRFEQHLQVAMAELAFRTGDLVGARELTEDSIDLARDEDDLQLMVELIAYRGMLQEQDGEYFAANKSYEEAQGLCGGLERPELEWRVLFDMGRLARKEERFTRALDMQTLALDLADQTENPSSRAACLNGIAYTLTFMGQHAEAREGAQAALAIWEQAGQPDQALMGPLHTLAVAALGDGKLDDVDRLLARADEIIDREDVSGLHRMTAAGVRSGFTGWGEVAQDGVSRRLDDPDADRAPLVAEGFDRAARWKARALLEGMPAASVPRDRIGSLRDELGADRVLIEYARGAENLYAYVLEADALTRLDLGPASDLDAQVEDYLAGMTQLENLASADEIAKRGGALHDLMLAPVLATLDRDVEGLVIVPTPGLARLPFEALVTSADTSRGAPLGFDGIEFLADRYHVTYGPSSPVLARLGELGPRRTPGRALVMGDPWYASEATGTARDPRTTTTANYDRLLATKAEVVGIAEALLLSDADQDDEVKGDLAELVALKRERSGKLESRRFDLYIGEAATADRLARDLREYEVVHIAAHGEVDPEDPLRTGLILSYDGNVHGYVTLLDILDMQLDANLVVLSACETASGRILKGEGVQSMAQAFLQAGSRAVVASLWSVDDQATRATMSQFYESILLDERRGAEALRDAKNLNELKRNVRQYGNARGDSVHGPSTGNVGHPYYWAPFIYVGAIP